MSAVHGVLPQDCGRCRRSDGLRLAWGCDAPSEQPFAFMRCPRCNGRNPDCELCKGEFSGVPLHRCPYTSIPDEIWSAVALLPEYRRGVLPVEGALFDQSATFVYAMKFLDAELNGIESEKLKSDG